MKQESKPIGSTIIWIVFAGIIAFIVPWLIYRSVWNETTLSTKVDEWNMFGTFFGGTVGPAIAFITMVITAVIAVSFNTYQKRQQQNADEERAEQTAIDLYKELRTYKLMKARSKAWDVKKKWNEKNPEKYRNKFIEAMLKEEPFKGTIDGISYDITKDEIQSVYDLISFYTLLSLYKNSGKTIVGLNYFFYPWWRKFLYEIATGRDKLRTENIFKTLEKKSETPLFTREKFIANISYQKGLTELDKICGFDELDHFFDFYTDFN